MIKTRRLNWRPDKPSLKYRKYGLQQPDGTPSLALPSAVDLRKAFPPVYDQKSIGSCTGNAWTALLEYIELGDLKANVTGPEFFEKGKFDPISRLFIYYVERQILGDTLHDTGAELSTGAQAVEQFGFCRESLWPYRVSKYTTKPSDEAYAEAALHTDKQCFKLQPSELKQCLAAGYPFVAGIMVYESMMSDTAAETGKIPMPDPSEGIEGGHAICIGGYDDTVQLFPGSRGIYWLRNSWGVDWGVEGWAMIPQEYLEHPDLSQDYWTIRPTI